MMSIPFRPAGKETRPRHVEIPFSDDYVHFNTRVQRVATIFRVPMMDGFVMPWSVQDSETAAMYKQLLLRPLAVPRDDRPPDQREQAAFEPMCCPLPDESAAAFSPSRAFTSKWLQHQRRMENDASEGRRRFLNRLEYPSLGNRRDEGHVASAVVGGRRTRQRPRSRPLPAPQS